MAVERIGYSLVSEKLRDVNAEPGEVTLAMSFLPVHHLNGKEEPWSPKQEALSAELGCKRVAVYFADVTYEGPKIHHSGLEIQFLATCSDELEAKIRTTPPGLVIGLMTDFYAGLHSNKEQENDKG